MKFGFAGFSAQFAGRCSTRKNRSKAMKGSAGENRKALVETPSWEENGIATLSNRSRRGELLYPAFVRERAGKPAGPLLLNLVSKQRGI